MGFYARQGWTGGDGVWEWDSRTMSSASRESIGRLQMEAEDFERKDKCKRHMDRRELRAKVG